MKVRAETRPLGSVAIGRSVNRSRSIARSPRSFTIAFLSVLFAPLLALSQQNPNLIILNANVRTMDKANPTTQAIAVKDGRIAAVGSTDDIRKFAGPETKIIDAEGRLVLPGFNDSHAHFMAIGNLFSSIDLSDAKTEADVIAKLQ